MFPVVIAQHLSIFLITMSVHTSKSHDCFASGESQTPHPEVVTGLYEIYMMAVASLKYDPIVLIKGHCSN